MFQRFVNCNYNFHMTFVWVKTDYLNFKHFFWRKRRPNRQSFGDLFLCQYGTLIIYFTSFNLLSSIWMIEVLCRLFLVLWENTTYFILKLKQLLRGISEEKRIRNELNQRRSEFETNWQVQWTSRKLDNLRAKWKTEPLQTFSDLCNLSLQPFTNVNVDFGRLLHTSMIDSWNIFLPFSRKSPSKSMLVDYRNASFQKKLETGGFTRLR